MVIKKLPSNNTLSDILELSVWTCGEAVVVGEQVDTDLVERLVNKGK